MFTIAYIGAIHKEIDPRRFFSRSRRREIHLVGLFSAGALIQKTDGKKVPVTRVITGRLGKFFNDFLQSLGTLIATMVKNARLPTVCIGQWSLQIITRADTSRKAMQTKDHLHFIQACGLSPLRRLFEGCNIRMQVR